MITSVNHVPSGLNDKRCVGCAVISKQHMDKTIIPYDVLQMLPGGYTIYWRNL